MDRRHDHRIGIRPAIADKFGEVVIECDSELLSQR